MRCLVISTAAILLLSAPAFADLKQARLLLDAGQIEAAREAYEEVLTRGEDREALYQLALLSTSGHDYVRYLQQFLDAGGRRDRRAAEIEIRLGRFHYTSGDYREALDFFESARDRRGDAAVRAEARFWLGRALMALRESKDARRAFEAVIGDRAGSAWESRAIYALGELLLVSGDPGGAAKNFTRLRTDANLGAAAMLAEALCREKLGDRREAAALYADLLRLRPTSSEAAMAREWTRLQEVSASVGAPPVRRGSGVPLNGGAPPDVDRTSTEGRAAPRGSGLPGARRVQRGGWGGRLAGSSRGFLLGRECEKAGHGSGGTRVSGSDGGARSRLRRALPCPFRPIPRPSGGRQGRP